MTKMSWIPSSKGTALVVLLALSLAAAGTAAGLSVAEQSAPSEAEAGQQVQASVVLEDPFVDTTNEWTLEGNTELLGDTATWTVTINDQGEEINETVYEGQNFSQALDSANGGDEVVIEVSGETPSPEGSYSYDPPQSFTIYDLNRVTGNSQTDIENGSQTVHHYTNESRTARQAIDAAAEAVNASDSSSAQDTLESAISSYDNGNFGNAQNLANDARSEAEDAEQSQETQQTILYAAVAIVILLLVGGSIYYWRSQQDDYGKLQ
jgi:flagellar basal body-associated protein FliL